jgi:Fur family zinc uptake transcriptional regulator
MARVTAPKTGSSGTVAKSLPGTTHHHSRSSTQAMAMAEASCASRGERLTPIRREVLGALLASNRPLGAYEILDRLSPYRGRAPNPGLTPHRRRRAPYAVYRALEFLCGNGFVHRIESRKAYLACVSLHAPGDLIVFLICDDCGGVGETSSPQVASGINSAARAADFTPKAGMIEITGICTRCREKRTDRKRAKTS